jgi:hypothetical protein
MSDYKKPTLVSTGVQKGLLKTPVYDAEFFEQETKRLGMSRAFWEGFKDGYVKTFVFGVSFGLGFAAGIFVREMM